MDKNRLIYTFVITYAIVNKIACVCENSYVVICDDLLDMKQNETTQWRYVQIGSTEFRREPSYHVLTASLTLSLSRVKSVTIINQIKQIKTPFTITHEPSFEYLNFYQNDIPQIEDYTFEDLKKLREVYLKNNNIVQLGRAIFKNTSVNVVDLSRNKIVAITTCFYETKIKWILINHNKLNYIKPGAFPPTLEQLHLDHNHLESFDELVFKNLPNLKELSIKHNRLRTIPSIAGLTAIRFLHFSYNNIESVDQPMKHADLEYVDLTSNLIRNVSLSLFGEKNVPPLVILTFNRLTDLKFERPQIKTDLVLFGNPWNCDCLFSIENTIKTYKHFKTCDLDCFRTGSLPLCIENGKCAENKPMSHSTVEAFTDAVKVCQDKSMCDFLL